MKRTIAVSTLTALMIVLTGCGGIAGNWTLQESDQGNFPISRVTLNDDGTYTAVSNYGDQQRESSGKYTFEDGKLTFAPDGGTERTYDAKLTGFGAKLEVSAVQDDKEVVATMRRDDDGDDGDDDDDDHGHGGDDDDHG